VIRRPHANTLTAWSSYQAQAAKLERNYVIPATAASLATPSFDIHPSPRENLPMVSQELLDLLVCPLCKKPLELKNEGQSLKCTQCRRVYPIKDDIPIMLVDEATIDPT